MRSLPYPVTGLHYMCVFTDGLFNESHGPVYKECEQKMDLCKFSTIGSSVWAGRKVSTLNVLANGR